MLWKRCLNNLIGQLRQLFFFGAVGVAATATHYMVAVASVEILSLTLQIANFFGFIAAFAVSFLGQSYFTFRAKPSSNMLIKYFALAGFNYLFSASILYFLAEYSSVGHRIALLITVLLIPIFTFIISKKYIFR